MNLLVIGGAGVVGTILRPMLEEFQPRYFDRQAMPELGDRAIVGDLADTAAVTSALEGVEQILWLAMGSIPGEGEVSCRDVNAAFDCNVRDLYRTLRLAGEANVRNFVYAGSLSVYGKLTKWVNFPLTEAMPGEAWDPYGFSKALGEEVGQAWVRRYPEKTFLTLRLMRPLPADIYSRWTPLPGRPWFPLGPEDTCALFRAALAFRLPGYHLVHCTGDQEGRHYPNFAARELLGWYPRGR